MKVFVEIEITQESSIEDVKSELELAIGAIDSEMFDSGIKILEIYKGN